MKLVIDLLIELLHNRQLLYIKGNTFGEDERHAMIRRIK